jgi:hypothetical protein
MRKEDMQIISGAVAPILMRTMLRSAEAAKLQCVTHPADDVALHDAMGLPPAQPSQAKATHSHNHPGGFVLFCRGELRPLLCPRCGGTSTTRPDCLAACGTCNLQFHRTNTAFTVG